MPYYTQDNNPNNTRFTRLGIALFTPVVTLASSAYGLVTAGGANILGRVTDAFLSKYDQELVRLNSQHDIRNFTKSFKRESDEVVLSEFKLINDRWPCTIDQFKKADVGKIIYNCLLRALCINDIKDIRGSLSEIFTKKSSLEDLNNELNEKINIRYDEEPGVGFEQWLTGYLTRIQYIPKPQEPMPQNSINQVVAPQFNFWKFAPAMVIFILSLIMAYNKNKISSSLMMLYNPTKLPNSYLLTFIPLLSRYYSKNDQAVASLEMVCKSSNQLTITGIKNS